MSLIAHFQDGPAQGRTQRIPTENGKVPTTLRIPVEVPPDVTLALPEGVTQPVKLICMEYRAIGGWKDKWGNNHVTYIPTEHEYGYSPVCTQAPQG